jgi:hypothetical protein
MNVVALMDALETLFKSIHHIHPAEAALPPQRSAA